MINKQDKNESTYDTNVFRYGWKIYCFKYTISKFEMFWVKAEDFMSAWGWAILSQKMEFEARG